MLKKTHLFWKIGRTLNQVSNLDSLKTGWRMKAQRNPLLIWTSCRWYILAHETSRLQKPMHMCTHKHRSPTKIRRALIQGSRLCQEDNNCEPSTSEHSTYRYPVDHSTDTWGDLTWVTGGIIHEAHVITCTRRLQERDRAWEEETEISKNSPAHLFLSTSKSESFRCLPKIALFGWIAG